MIDQPHITLQQLTVSTIQFSSELANAWQPWDQQSPTVRAASRVATAGGQHRALLLVPARLGWARLSSAVRRSGSSDTLVRLPQVTAVEHDLTKHTHEWQRARCFTWLHQKLTACSVFFLHLFTSQPPAPQTLENATSSPWGCSAISQAFIIVDVLLCNRAERNDCLCVILGSRRPWFPHVSLKRSSITANQCGPLGCEGKRRRRRREKKQQLGCGWWQMSLVRDEGIFSLWVVWCWWCDVCLVRL